MTISMTAVRNLFTVAESAVCGLSGVATRIKAQGVAFAEVGPHRHAIQQAEHAFRASATGAFSRELCTVLSMADRSLGNIDDMLEEGNLQTLVALAHVRIAQAHLELISAMCAPYANNQE